MNPSLAKRLLALMLIALGAAVVNRYRNDRARRARERAPASEQAAPAADESSPSALEGLTVSEALALQLPVSAPVRRWFRRRRRLVGLAVALLLVVAAGWYLHLRSASRDVVGSASVEFVTTDVPAGATTPPPLTTPAATGPARPTLARVIWPTYGLDNRRLRNFPGGPKPPFRVLWTFPGGSLLEFPPTLAYGRLTISTNHGRLVSVDAATGKARWTFESGRCVAASPAVARRVIYASFMNRPPCNASGSSLDGQVIAFDALSGKIRWRATVGVNESSPLVSGGLVTVGDWNGDVTALDARTGVQRWRFHTGGKVKGAPALADGRLVIGSYDGAVYALDPQTGALLWKASSQERIGSRGTFYATPALAFGRVYIGATDGKVYSFGAESGKLRWSQSTGGYVYASAAIWRQSVLVGSYSGSFFSLDAATGAEQWRFRAAGPISGSAVVIGDVVYVATLARKTYALDAATGKLLWTFPDGQYGAAITDGTHLYLVGTTRLYAMVPRG